MKTNGIKQLLPSAALERQAAGAVIIDVREPAETEAGRASGSLEIPLAELEGGSLLLPGAENELLLLCATGRRSQRACEHLAAAGYTNIANITGGFVAWAGQSLPVDWAQELNASRYQRYARHLAVPEVGVAGQQRLLRSRVLLIGAGGLGSPAALYLAAAGVGTLGLIDADVVERSNLQRQILHSEETLGELKTESGKARINRLNPDVLVKTYDSRLTQENIDEILPGYDVVLDGSDNLPTRYLANDGCIKHGIPLVYGAVFRFQGQVSVFWPTEAGQENPCYRCLFPEPPPPEATPSCAEAGVLGVLPGIIGTLQAAEVVKLLLGIGQPLTGRLLLFDALMAECRTVRLPPDPHCAYCSDTDHFPGYIEYETFCLAG